MATASKKFNLPKGGSSKSKSKDAADTRVSTAPPTEKFEYETVNAPPPVPEVVAYSPPRKAMRGNVWVFNKLNESFSVDFNSEPQEFEAHEFREYPEPIARFLAAKSTFMFQSNNKEVRALVNDGKKGFGEAHPDTVTAKGRIEMIDRGENPNPLGRGTDGVPTKPKVIHV